MHEQNGESHHHMQPSIETDSHHGDHHGHADPIIIDGQKYPVHHENITGRNVLEIAGRHPIDDYIVLWRDAQNILEDLALDRAVHPSHQSILEFYTFKSDRSFRFDLDGRREEWGAPFITESTLRKLGDAGHEDRVVQELHGHSERVLKDGERVNLTGEGVEKFRIDRAITITVVNEDNGKDFPITGFKETKISTLIEKMYRKLGMDRKDDDRLRCENGGGDVFHFANLTLGAYLEAGHCHCKVWLFVGGTGGAGCQ